MQAAINASLGDLPTNLDHNAGAYRNFNPSDSPIMILGLTSDTMAPGEVYNYALRCPRPGAEPGRRRQPGDGERVPEIGGAGAGRSGPPRRDGSQPGGPADFSRRDQRQSAQGQPRRPRRSAYGLRVNDQLDLLRPITARSVAVHKPRRALRLERPGRRSSTASRTPVRPGWQNGKPAVLLIIYFKQTRANVIETVDRIRAPAPGAAVDAARPSGSAIQTDRTGRSAPRSITWRRRWSSRSCWS